MAGFEGAALVRPVRSASMAHAGRNPAGARQCLQLCELCLRFAPVVGRGGGKCHHLRHAAAGVGGVDPVGAVVGHGNAHPQAGGLPGRTAVPVVAGGDERIEQPLFFRQPVRGGRDRADRAPPFPPARRRFRHHHGVADRLDG